MLFELYTEIQRERQLKPGQRVWVAATTGRAFGKSSSLRYGGAPWGSPLSGCIMLRPCKIQMVIVLNKKKTKKRARKRRRWVGTAQRIWSCDVSDVSRMYQGEWKWAAEGTE